MVQYKPVNGDLPNYPGYEWVNTPGYKTDRSIAGMPMHAVKLDGESKTLCGIRRKQWICDLLNYDRCERCAAIIAKMFPEIV